MTKINLTNKTISTRHDRNSESEISKAIDQPPDGKVSINQQLLLQTAPGKLLYSIRETARILGVSYEFVREKVFSGRVIAKSFGARKLIHVFEVSRLLTEGLA